MPGRLQPPECRSAPRRADGATGSWPGGKVRGDGEGDAPRFRDPVRFRATAWGVSTMPGDAEARRSNISRETRGSNPTGRLVSSFRSRRCGSSRLGTGGAGCRLPRFDPGSAAEARVSLAGESGRRGRVGFDRASGCTGSLEGNGCEAISWKQRPRRGSSRRARRTRASPASQAAERRSAPRGAMARAIPRCQARGARPPAKTVFAAWITPSPLPGRPSPGRAGSGRWSCR
jgi:hypothetical protein